MVRALEFQLRGTWGAREYLETPISLKGTQSLQNPLIKEHTLNYDRIHNMI